jgi:hypothetical protein
MACSDNPCVQGCYGQGTYDAQQDANAFALCQGKYCLFPTEGCVDLTKTKPEQCKTEWETCVAGG